MEIRNNFNKQNFKGIKLSSNKFEDVRDVAFHLRNSGGYENLGHKTIYTSNTSKDKIRAIQNVREENGIANGNFGAVFLPWSKEAYIVSTPAYEQKMLPIVKEMDPKAQINLAM